LLFLGTLFAGQLGTLMALLPFLGFGLVGMCALGRKGGRSPADSSRVELSFMGYFEYWVYKTEKAERRKLGRGVTTRAPNPKINGRACVLFGIVQYLSRLRLPAQLLKPILNQTFYSPFTLSAKIIPNTIRIAWKIVSCFLVASEIRFSGGEISKPFTVLFPKTDVDESCEAGISVGSEVGISVEGMDVGAFVGVGILVGEDVGVGVGVGVLVGAGIGVGVGVNVGVGVGAKFIETSTEDIVSPDPAPPEVVYLLTLSLYVPLPVKLLELELPTRPWIADDAIFPLITDTGKYCRPSEPLYQSLPLYVSPK